MVDEILRRYLERSRPQIHESQLGRHHEIFQACEEAAEKIAVPVSMALVDETGSLVSFYRMAGALLVSEALAQKKHTRLLR